MVLPPLVIMLTTYRRPQYARQVIEAALVNLKYANKIWWYIADGGSDPRDFELYDSLIQNGYGMHSQPNTPGNNWNTGITRIYEQNDIYFRLEDDFVLREPLDISEYVRVLLNHEEVGMIRLGLLPKGLDLKTVGIKDEIYLDVQKSQQYCFSGHPSLVHKRFHTSYGLFGDNPDPGNCELDMDASVRTLEGPAVYYPLKLASYGTFGPWGHIGAIKSIEA